MENKWIQIKSKDDLPKRLGDGSYEQQDCLCLYKGRVIKLVWNCEHEVWDDEDGDDYFCDALDVSAWQPLPQPPEVEND